MDAATYMLVPESSYAHNFTLDERESLFILLIMIDGDNPYTDNLSIP